MRFFDVSTATELEATATVLGDLHRDALRCGVEIMVIGATARDILIRHVVGSAPERATADIDIAVAVSSWRDVDRLTEAMRRVPRIAHRFLVGGIEVDIIPFGEIESETRTITWSNDFRLDVFGFREAFASAVQVRLPGGLVVAVASLPAQSPLKLFAWRDRRYQSRRDAVDLKAILCAYQEGRYFEELYTHYGSLPDRHDFDHQLAGAERMGREACALIASADRPVVMDLLSSEHLFDALIGDMGGAPDVNGALLSAYRDGFG